MKRFNIVLPKEDGGIELHPMKEWLRQHPDRVPPGLDATASTSHHLRAGLRKLGWTVQELESEVRLLEPGHTESESMVAAVLGTDGSEDTVEPGDTSFGLEYQLRDFLAQNLNVIPVQGQRIQVYVDPAGRDGVEYQTAVGPIDILGVDSAGGFVVFELKRARTPDRAIGQLTRYMGWVKHTIADGKPVRGVVVAKTITDKLRYAAAVIPNVSLLEYQVSFQLNAAPPLGN